MSATGDCFTPEPPPPSKPASGPSILLPYNHIWTELISLGVSWERGMRMSWGTVRMLFEARAEAYEASRSRMNGDDVRYATKEDYSNWI